MLPLRVTERVSGEQPTGLCGIIIDYRSLEMLALGGGLA